MKTLPIQVVSAYVAYGQPRAIVNVVEDLDRKLSLGPYYIEMPGIFSPVPCCHTILRAYQQGRKNVQLEVTRERKDRKGKYKRGQVRKGEERAGKKMEGHEGERTRR